MHLSAAMEVPTIGLLGKTDPDSWNLGERGTSSLKKGKM